MPKMEMPEEADKETPAEDAPEALGFSEQIANLLPKDKALLEKLVERFNSK